MAFGKSLRVLNPQYLVLRIICIKLSNLWRTKTSTGGHSFGIQKIGVILRKPFLTINEIQKLTLIILILLCNRAVGQDKIYKLISKTENASIDYKAFKCFNTTKIYKKDRLKKAFDPKKGKSTVYLFISEYYGVSYEGMRKIFHDYLILKVEPRTELIIDGFQYTLEWAEPPAISDLYRVTNKNIKMRSGLNIDSLKMELNKKHQTEDRKYLTDKGTLYLK